MNSEEIVKMIEAQGDAIMSKIILDAIEAHKPQAEKMFRLYNRYKGDVPIKERRSPDKAGISLNNKINNDYEGIIVDEIVGYIWGHSIVTSYNDEGLKESVGKILERFEILNNIDSLDEETGEYSCGCGYGARLCYFDKLGELRVMNTKPWQTYFIYNNSTDEIDYAMIYYPWEIVDVPSGKVTKTTKVEWYNKEEVSYWIKQGGRFEKEKLEEGGYQNPQPHNFDFVPVIKFKGNNLEQSDLEKVESLIDGYNELISDAQNELQEFVHAYLAATGASIDEEERLKSRRTRVFNLPDKESHLEFITKDINDAFFEHQKKTLNDNIFRFSKTVDMNDEKFSAGGAESGEARKWKLLALEFKAVKKERKFIEGLRMMYKVIASAWNKRQMSVDYLKLNFQFTRSLPIDFLYYADIALKLKGTLSLLTILSLLPFVKDPQTELDKLEEEQTVNLDLIPEKIPVNGNDLKK